MCGTVTFERRKEGKNQRWIGCFRRKIAEPQQSEIQGDGNHISWRERSTFVKKNTVGKNIVLGLEGGKANHRGDIQINRHAIFVFNVPI